MEGKDHEIISNNINKLVQHTNFQSLLRTCEEKGTLYTTIVTNIFLHAKNLYDEGKPQTLEEIQHHTLLKKITHRGPRSHKINLHSIRNYFNSK